jgi:hypothetical protein
MVLIKSNDAAAFAVGTGSLNQYKVESNGKVDGDSLIQTSTNIGNLPFSFVFDKDDQLVLTEAFGISDAVVPLSATVAIFGNIDIFDGITEPNLIDREGTQQSATCWVNYSEKTGCTFVTDAFGDDSAGPGTGVGSVTSFRVTDSNIELIESGASVLDAPLDLTFSKDDEYLYVLSTAGNDPMGQPSIYVYKVDSESCGIVQVQTITDGLPNVLSTVFGVVGLVSN